MSLTFIQFHATLSMTFSCAQDSTQQRLLSRHQFTTCTNICNYAWLLCLAFLTWFFFHVSSFRVLFRLFLCSLANAAVIASSSLSGGCSSWAHHFLSFSCLLCNKRTNNISTLLKLYLQHVVTFKC